MHEILSDLTVELESIISKINTLIPSNEPFSIAHANWTFPGLTKNDLINRANNLISLIECIGDNVTEDNVIILADYKRRLRFISDSTIPNLWSNAAAGVPAYLLTLDELKKELDKLFDNNYSTELQKAVRKLRALEATLKGVEPRTASLSSMVERIEQAFNTAEQLPADLDLLSESRDKIKEIASKSDADANKIAILKENSSDILNNLREMKENAEEILKRCETAYAASTSVGLAAAFNERSINLNKSMTFWIAGLIIALSAAAIFGTINVHSLLVATGSAQPSPSVITIRLFLSILSIGGPVWFAWLATKQIGQRFRLSEDYAFKASISRAYEGFRSEASRIDKNLEIKLLASALSRLDELPLRLVETETHGSPYHELLSSDNFKEALKVIPGFSERIKKMAEKALNDKIDSSKGKESVSEKTASAEKNDS
ncbi:TPA: hypothetical protein ACHV3X_001474 [Klebsiella variicola]|uniref:hypothetical protein n=1 Tax=Klebsiella pneumoniae complex TaxID=3390273 RepID=UPI0011582AC5|nr:MULTISPECIES: hypothetical protein [Klebsiella]HCI6639430.1 hypothetical protein [Klebsiella variicola subsp. variicola]HDT4792263.1 hypothetical protein [Klebsiella pneumoniae subsp. pneumoniae]EIY5372549.1 hypothetical protein [Klebsiella variicola]MBQ5243705.1 hypothetical protein [Klebsiella pneumoniae]MCP6113841.1 hypothetical protein [Klebsiella pneumoniae]